MLPELEPVEMTFECPECLQQVILLVGLSPNTRHNEVFCPGCNARTVALVPGPVVDGPFPVSRK
jgi:Zn finger protein HypA/HybF involved in hydrogenase expression